MSGGKKLLAQLRLHKRVKDKIATPSKDGGSQ